MTVIVYYCNRMKPERVELVHEILERENDYALTYTDLSDNTYKSKLVRKTDVDRMGVRV